ncbi:hypothetical protein ACVIIZ_003464 [Bradyrhizobium sp. USDA 4523]|uniref:hypothetical protein n=1 Tax=unclassified Bradyrhizobium TaxID=2631580 RepID=UPI0020A21770|nr:MULTISPECIES: hypothetical protein [unclassified Bradyrhizobium]MCP1837160.1 hypothetical protein [Bradyrhizobium sp. USDA 4538]MCP1988167.1 hypothetical protein [Bradyrhizobium sp. USDA 4539]
MKLLDLDVALEQGNGSCLHLLCQRFARGTLGNGSSDRTGSAALITQDARCTACAIWSGKALRHSVSAPFRLTAAGSGSAAAR